MYNKMKTREKGILSFIEKIIIGRDRTSMTAVFNLVIAVHPYFFLRINKC